jgi:hypothetical protein
VLSGSGAGTGGMAEHQVARDVQRGQGRLRVDMYLLLHIFCVGLYSLSACGLGLGLVWFGVKQESSKCYIHGRGGCDVVIFGG